MSQKKLVPALVICLLLASGIFAQEETADASGDAAQANNPLADFSAFNIHNYYIPQLSGLDNQNANTLWLRHVRPIGRWLLRASAPVSRVPTGVGTTTSGLGDINAFAAYLFDTGDPAKSFGVGPEIVLPTATEDETGSGKYQLGLAAVYFDASSKRFQWGGLVIWQTDVAGDDDRADVSLLAIQPFYMFQLGQGFYFRGAPAWVFDLEANSYHVPLGFGLGKVISTPKTVYNMFVEPQVTILDRGVGQPELQIFMGFNMQFR